jgi:hypothetical protein
MLKLGENGKFRCVKCLTAFRALPQSAHLGGSPPFPTVCLGIFLDNINWLTEKSYICKIFLDCVNPHRYPNVSVKQRKYPIPVPVKTDMATTLTLPPVCSSERNRLLSADSIRRRALERLYERRETVENLIIALEGYQRARETRLAQCIALPPIPTSQSGFFRSRI